MNKTEEKIWFRYEDVSYAPSLDQFEQPVGPSTIKVHLRRYLVIKETPKGVWLSLKIGDWTDTEKRFVREDAHKRFACPTVEEAKVSFIARKKRQISIYQARINQAKQALRLIEGDKTLDDFLEHCF